MKTKHIFSSRPRHSIAVAVDRFRDTPLHPTSVPDIIYIITVIIAHVGNTYCRRRRNDYTDETQSIRPSLVVTSGITRI